MTLGIAEYDLGRFAASVEAYDRALALHPTDAAHSNRGNSLLKLGKLTQALSSYARAPKFGRG